MKRRVYFLAPNSRQAERLVADLSTAAIARCDIHCLASDPDCIADLPAASWQQRRDLQAQVERLARNTNLWMFFAALALCLIGVFMQWTLLSVVMLGVMILAFGFGLAATYLPYVHISDFQNALRHGEVLVFCDVDKERLLVIERRIRHHLPQVILAGVGWCAGYGAL